MNRKNRQNKKSKKVRFWNSLRFRVSAGLILTFGAGGLILCLTVQSQLNRSLTQRIQKECNDLRLDSQIYSRQIFMMRGENNDEEGMIHCSQEILNELSRTNGRKLFFYTLDGILTASGPGEIPSGTDGDSQITGTEAFAHALKGEAAFTMVCGSGSSCQVFFSSPVQVEEQNVGILAAIMDYSSIRRENQEILRMMVQVVCAGYLLSGLVVFFLLWSVTQPLKILSQISGKVSRTMKKEHMPIGNPLKDSPLLKRKDEIGELASSYSRMMETIELQFEKIQQDRDSIRSLMESRQEFYNNVTHELKTPLTTIQGYAQLLEDGGAEDTQFLEKSLGHILGESTRLHRMVVQLLEMGDREADGSPEPVDLFVLAKSVAASMMPKAKRNGWSFLVKGHGPLLTLGYEERLRQVLINLTDNAIKYGKQGGEIVLDLRSVREQVLIQVINRGDPIPQNRLEEIFEPFCRIDKEYSRELGSAGLGLSICRKIIQEHHGVIRAFSHPNGINIFAICLKLYRTQEAEE